MQNLQRYWLNSKTILWNGPLGVFELDTFSKGTISLGNAIVASTENGAFSLVGGGDSVAAAKQFGLSDKVSYVSTGGGAMLRKFRRKDLTRYSSNIKLIDSITMGIIKVENIKLYAFHGCLDEEARIGSEYCVDVTVTADLSKSALTDDLNDTVDYVLLNKIVAEEMAIRSKVIRRSWATNFR